MNNIVYQATYLKDGFSLIEPVDAITISFVAEIFDDEDRYYYFESDYAELSEESGLSVLQIIAINGREFNLEGRKRVDDDTVIEKHLGWMSWHETNEIAESWIKDKKLIPRRAKVDSREGC